MTPNASWDRSHGHRGVWWSEVNPLLWTRDRNTTPRQDHHPQIGPSHPTGQDPLPSPLDWTHHPHPCGQHPPPPIHTGTAVNGPEVRILLECILVFLFFLHNQVKHNLQKSLQYCFSEKPTTNIRMVHCNNRGMY